MEVDSVRPMQVESEEPIEAGTAEGYLSHLEVELDTG